MSGGGGNDNGQGGSYNPAQLGALFGTKLTDYVNNDTPFFDANMFTGPGQMTQDSWAQQRDHALTMRDRGDFGGALNYTSDLIRQGGLTPGMNADIGQLDQIGATYGNIDKSLTGRKYGTTSPAYQRMRAKLADDVTTQSLGAFNASGLFGSDENQSSLAQGLGDALGGMDLDQQRYGDSMERGDIGLRMAALQGRQGAEQGAYGMRQGGIDNAMGAASTLRDRYNDWLAPSETLAGVGATQDAASQGQRLGDADYYDRKNNGNYNRFAELMSLFSNSQGNAGMEEKPSFLQLLMGGLGTGIGAIGGAFR
jgi:hypothetical protein